MVEAFVTPSLIKWARERYKLTTEAAARKVRIDPQVLDDWEKGEARPSLHQAQEYAQKLNLPFGYLFLSSPPILRLPLPDLRTVGDAPPREPSPEFYDLINDVMSKQEWYHEYRESLDAEPLPFVGRFASLQDKSQIADDICKELGVNDAMRATARSWEQFLVNLIRKAEDLGILVLRNGVVGNNTRRPLSTEEFRGFAISDDLAPLIFLNSLDSKAAQIFTLAHELTHLWMGQSAVSNPNYLSEQNNDVESLCNEIAAEILVPAKDFLIRWDEGTTIFQNLQRLATRYRVSTWVILRRALEVKKIDYSTYRSNLDKLITQQEVHRNTGTDGGGGNFYLTLLSRNSRSLTSAVISATAEGRLLRRDAARLLNVQVSTLSGIAKNIFGSKLA